jgi:hypothetical protein
VFGKASPKQADKSVGTDQSEQGSGRKA